MNLYTTTLTLIQVYFFADGHLQNCKTATFNFQLTACRDVVAAVATAAAVVDVVDVDEVTADGGTSLQRCFDAAAVVAVVDVADGEIPGNRLI